MGIFWLWFVLLGLALGTVWRKRVGAWRTGLSKQGLWAWLITGVLGALVSSFNGYGTAVEAGYNPYAGNSLGIGVWMLICALSVWILLIGGYELNRRDNAKRREQQREWEEALRAEARRIVLDQPVSEKAPPGGPAAPPPPPHQAPVLHQRIDGAIDLSEAILGAAHPPAAGADAPVAAPAAAGPAGSPMRVHLGVASRFARQPGASGVIEEQPAPSGGALAGPAPAVPGGAIVSSATPAPPVAQPAPAALAGAPVPALSASPGPSTLGTAGPFKYRPRLVRPALEKSKPEEGSNGTGKS